MPSPAIYALAVVGTVAAGLAFKEFVYDPHLAPLIEEVLERRRLRRQHSRMEDSWTYGTELHERDPARDHRPFGLRRRQPTRENSSPASAFPEHQEQPQIIFDADVSGSARSSAYQPAYVQELKERPSQATIRSPSQSGKSQQMGYHPVYSIPSPSLSSTLDVGSSSSFLIEPPTPVVKAPEELAGSWFTPPLVPTEVSATPSPRSISPAVSIASSREPMVQSSPQVASLSITHPVSLLESDGEMLSRPGSVLSTSTATSSSLSISSNSDAGGDDDGVSSIHATMYHSFAPSPVDATATLDMDGLIRPLSPSQSSTSSFAVPESDDDDMRSLSEFDGSEVSAVESFGSWDDLQAHEEIRR